MFNDNSDNPLDVTMVNQKMNERKGRKKKRSIRKTQKNISANPDLQTDRVNIVGFTHFCAKMNIDKICMKFIPIRSQKLSMLGFGAFSAKLQSQAANLNNNEPTPQRRNAVISNNLNSKMIHQPLLKKPSLRNQSPQRNR